MYGMIQPLIFWQPNFTGTKLQSPHALL